MTVSLFMHRYLINTAELWVIAVILPVFFHEIAHSVGVAGDVSKNGIVASSMFGIKLIPIGLAILMLNTPISILISCDPSTDQAIRVLPGQFSRFLRCYCGFMFLVNMVASTIYLISTDL